MTTLTKPRVTWGDLVQVAWLRHRSLILATTAAVAVGVVGVVWAWLVTPLDRKGMSWVNHEVIRLAVDVDMAFVLVVAMFWGAPLVAREYELRTNLVAWGQDVSSTRWLTGQIVLFGVLAAGFAAIIGWASIFMISKGRASDSGFSRPPFNPDSFEAVPHVQVGYALLALAIGLAASALTKRTLPAMALAFVGLIGARVVLSSWGRENYLPPVHTFEAWTPPGVDYRTQVPDDALYVASGYADAGGTPMDSPEVCRGVADLTGCAKANGVAGHYAEFQPIERLELFQWVETGICLVLAAGLLVLAWWWVGRARRV